VSIPELLGSVGNATHESEVPSSLTSVPGLAMEEEAATMRPEQDSPANGIASPRLYSDVVATRPSSAASQYDDTQHDAGILEIRSAPTTPYLEGFLSQVDHTFNDNSILFSSTQVITEDYPDEESSNNHGTWTLVKSKSVRRHCSLDTEATEFLTGNSLTSEQKFVVKMAEQNLTTDERENQSSL
jgi:hypothetical protein